jgi:hypothetical protein
MSVENPTVVQILVAWRDNKWLVARNAVEVGAYAYRAHALDMARTLSAEARRLGVPCYMLVRDEAGKWQERRCPQPREAGQG